MWFERLFDPFDRRNSFEPSGVAYPAGGEGGRALRAESMITERRGMKP